MPLLTWKSVCFLRFLLHLLLSLLLLVERNRRCFETIYTNSVVLLLAMDVGWVSKCVHARGNNTGIARIVLVLLCRKVEKLWCVPVQLRCNWNECVLHEKLQFDRVVIEIESKLQFRSFWQKRELLVIDFKMYVGYKKNLVNYCLPY